MLVFIDLATKLLINPRLIDLAPQCSKHVNIVLQSEERNRDTVGFIDWAQAAYKQRICIVLRTIELDQTYVFLPGKGADEH
jgi:hypothetical protein